MTCYFDVLIYLEHQKVISDFLSKKVVGVKVVYDSKGKTRMQIQIIVYTHVQFYCVQTHILDLCSMLKEGHTH